MSLKIFVSYSTQELETNKALHNTEDIPIYDTHNPVDKNDRI
jgi:hypothetical protein